MFKQCLVMLITILYFHTCFADEKTALMLAKNYSDQSVVGWLASEKLDGVRGFWDGKRMYSKQGNVYLAPKAFVKGFPKFALDGELYSGRGEFANISSIVRSGQDWSSIKFHVFDVPHATGGLMARLNTLETWLKSHPNPNIIVIKQTPVKNIEHAQRMLDEVVKLGGEGIMLHHPDTPYIGKRSDTLLKLKKAQDAECVVTQYQEGKGKYTGKMGAIICKIQDGTLIKIGTGFSDKQRDNPPPIGSTITYRYNGLTKHGKPRFARFWRLRFK